jgi:monodictyphenone polyketide synthase
MEVICFNNEFPKEDLQDIFRLLHNRSKDRRHPLLAQFICEATLAVKDEANQLPHGLKQLIPPFETLFTWSENTELREGLLCGAVDGVLLVLVQISLYIR